MKIDTPGKFKAEIICPDFDKLEALGVPIPPQSAGKWTQVFIYVPDGNHPAVMVEVEGLKPETAVLIPYYNGGTFAVVTFRGFIKATPAISLLMKVP